MAGYTWTALQRELVSAARTQHGHSGRNERTGTYNSWRAMLDRTRAAARGVARYKAYTGVGVWRGWDPRRGGSFHTFLCDMSWRPPCTSLDRINPEGDYTPENCRWADIETQNNNQRRYLDIP